MKAFAQLLDALYFCQSTNSKSQYLIEYLSSTPDPDRGWAIAALAGDLKFKYFKRALIQELIKTRVDPHLYELSYDYVGETSETVAHLWPGKNDARMPNSLPRLSKVQQYFSEASKEETAGYLHFLLDNMNSTQRWALLKLGTGGLRVGVSARFIKKVLAQYGGCKAEEIEVLWHGLTAPYTDLLSWLDGKGPKPEVDTQQSFHPVMLAHPVSEDVLKGMDLSQWQVQWKYDGIRVQLLATKNGNKLFSRAGDDISHSFPDLLHGVNEVGRFDGELLVIKDGAISSFNDLQQRLNKKKPSVQLQKQYPVALMIYDVLSLEGVELSQRSLEYRYNTLINWYQQKLHSRGLGEVNSSSNSSKKPSEPSLAALGSLQHQIESAVEVSQEHFREGLQSESLVIGLNLAPSLVAKDFSDLVRLRERTKLNSQELASPKTEHQAAPPGVEGLMLKAKQSPYLPGRVKGHWYKWKRDALEVDAVMMYAQKGHGKRSSFYSDYTFGLWQDQVLIPIGKAYSGFTDDELKQLDAWVRKNTQQRFGSVRQVFPELVLQVAFDSVQSSKRHKSGLALRFPRIARIRWDKDAKDAGLLDEFKALYRV